MAQIINYHQWPPRPVGFHQIYLDELSIDTLPYQFSLMPDDLYSTYDTAQLNAVRHLMRDCAIASNTWDFDRLSKKDAIFAAFWYDSHDKDENVCYYMNDKYEAKIK